jgi:NaMN:DMB phosphoribosyltransferase
VTASVFWSIAAGKAACCAIAAACGASVEVYDVGILPHQANVELPPSSSIKGHQQTERSNNQAAVPAAGADPRVDACNTAARTAAQAMVSVHARQIAPGTRNMRVEAAMTSEQLHAALQVCP